jgi:hypothetical protein
LSVFNLIGKVTADNGIDDVLVNGSSTGFKYGDPNSGVYGAFTNLLITSGFHTGVNTLTFNILSSAGPVGLRTDFSGTTFTPAVPEAETLAMLLTGLGVMTLSLRSRKHKRT